MSFLTNVPTLIQRKMRNVDMRELVFIKVFNDLAENEQIEEVRESIRFSEEFHKEHKKFNAYYSNGCGCDYCKATHEYAKAVVELHRLERRRDAYYDSNLRDSLHILRSLHEVRKRKDKYKKIKDELKEKIVLSRL